MVGIPGSGKTFFAEKFATTFNAPYVSLEKIAMHMPENPQGASEIAAYQLDELFKTGQSVIVEGLTDTRISRMELAKKARKNSYDTLLVWVQTDSATAKDRIGKRLKADTGHALDPEEYERALKRFTAPSAIEKPVVISGKHTYASQAKVVLKKLAGPRAAISTHTVAPIRPESQPGRRNISIR